MKNSLIAARGLSAGYAGVPAIREIDLEVNPGEVVTLMGPNGAGKTTTLMTLAGELRPMAGEVIWNGLPIRMPLHRRVGLGMGLITEQRSVIMSLTVAENLRIGLGDTAKAYDLFPELSALSKRRAGLLSGGEQQMLAVARALSSSPALLMADELSLGLAPLVARRILEVIRRAADEGAAVLLVEQHAHHALAVADRAYVMRQGQIILSGTAEDLAKRVDLLRDSYLTAAGSE